MFWYSLQLTVSLLFLDGSWFPLWSPEGRCVKIYCNSTRWSCEKSLGKPLAAVVASSSICWQFSGWLEKFCYLFVIRILKNKFKEAFCFFGCVYFSSFPPSLSLSLSPSLSFSLSVFLSLSFPLFCLFPFFPFFPLFPLFPFILLPFPFPFFPFPFFFLTLFLFFFFLCFYHSKGQIKFWGRGCGVFGSCGNDHHRGSGNVYCEDSRCNWWWLLSYWQRQSLSSAFIIQWS